jgi:signal transduction histidine kinase
MGMTIRNRLTLLFSLVATAIFLVFSCTVYFFTSEYRKNEFNNRLKKRVEITEKIFLEGKNIPDFKAMQEQFQNKLPEETEEVVPLNADYRSNLKHSYPSAFLTELQLSTEAFFQDGDRQGAGRIFHVNNRDYLVLLTAVDYVGIQMMDHLITVIVIVMAVCAVAMASFSHIVSGSLINPISSKIRKANSISANNLHERLNVINPDNELGQLALAFNGLLNRVEQAFYVQKLFIDNASHEIRNPLTAIIGETEWALESPRQNKEYIESFEVIASEADRLNVLVNNLLQLAGIHHQNVSFSRERIPIYELLTQAKEKLSMLHPQENVQISLSEARPVHKLCIEGNRHLLTTAFFNLLDNASKFSDFKSVDVSISSTDSTNVEISIRDNGVGIPSSEIKNITQPFHRASNVRSIRGTGIGIPLTLRIIELHGGKLRIDSALNEGTTAIVTLPVTADYFLI